MPRADKPTNGNGKAPISTTGQGLEEYPLPTENGASNTAFNLSADATIGSLLNSSDEQYAVFVSQLRNARQIKVKQRAREVANILNPHLQQEEIMVEAQRIVEAETAGMQPTGHSLPTFRLLGGMH